MNLLIKISIITTSILFIGFSIGSYIMLTRKLQPKIRAFVATILVFLMFIYCILLTAIGLDGIFFRNIHFGFALLFALLPFVFGKLVQYKTLKRYTLFQLISIFVSLVYLTGHLRL